MEVQSVLRLHVVQRSSYGGRIRRDARRKWREICGRDACWRGGRFAQFDLGMLGDSLPEMRGAPALEGYEGAVVSNLVLLANKP